MRAGYKRAPPVGALRLNVDSPHARGAVLVAPFLNGLPPMNLVDRDVWDWSGTAPSYSISESSEDAPINAFSVDGNGSQFVSTGRDYGLTAPSAMTVEWWMNEPASYLGADLARNVLSNRTSGNAGFSCGRNSAVGGPPGNATSMTYTVHGVAVYSSNYSVPARRWVHCCCTLEGTSLRQYIDGELDSSHTVGSPTTGQNLQLLCTSPAPTVTTQRWLNDLHSLVVRAVVLSAEEVALRADPVKTWDLYAPPRRRLYLIPKAAAAGASLTPASVSHAHALDALPWIAQVHQLAPPDVAHAHALDATTVSEAPTLAAADVAHGHALDAATVVQTHTLTVADVAHAQALDAGVLVQTHTLSPADAGHGHALDATTVSQDAQLLPADVAHGHALDAPAVTQTHQLTPGDVGHAQALDAAVLTVTHILQAAGIDHAHALDATTATPTQLLVAADIAHAHALESPGVTQTHVIVVSDVLHAHLLDAATVTGGVEVLVTPLGSVIYVHADPAVIVVAADPTTIIVH